MKAAVTNEGARCGRRFLQPLSLANSLVNRSAVCILKSGWGWHETVASNGSVPPGLHLIQSISLDSLRPEASNKTKSKTMMRQLFRLGTGIATEQKCTKVSDALEANIYPSLSRSCTNRRLAQPI